MKQINILYQSSSAYVIPAAVSICSLYENNKDIDRISIWFIDVGLSQKDRDGLFQLAKRYNREIIFISCEETDKMLSEAGVKLWSGSYATFYKIFACCKMKELNQILYIDADTLILDSISQLCEYNMDGYACAMVGSGITRIVKDYIGVKEYYNAGVIYFNLKYWREHAIEKDFLNVIHGDDCEKYTVVGDETLNNYVLRGKIKKLPLKYNYESSWWLWGWNCKLYESLGWMKSEECYYSQHEIQEAKESPCIAHYVDLTTGRPWDYLNDNQYRIHFSYYMNMLEPWKNIDFKMRGMGGNNKMFARLKWMIKKVMPFSVRSRIGFYQHNSYWKKRIEELEYAGKNVVK